MSPLRGKLPCELVVKVRIKLFNSLQDLLQVGDETIYGSFGTCLRELDSHCIFENPLLFIICFLCHFTTRQSRCSLFRGFLRRVELANLPNSFKVPKIDEDIMLSNVATDVFKKSTPRCLLQELVVETAKLHLQACGILQIFPGFEPGTNDHHLTSNAIFTKKVYFSSVLTIYCILCDVLGLI